ncbi:MAG: hypothetical protein WAK55_17465 [Xanthobacteraceae bacterium]
MKPYNLTNEQIEEAIAARAAFKARVGKKAARGLGEFVDKLQDALMAFRMIEDDVEFTAKEKNHILGGFEDITLQIASQAERATGFIPGIGDLDKLAANIADRKTKIDEMVENSIKETFELGGGVRVAFIKG